MEPADHGKGSYPDILSVEQAIAFWVMALIDREATLNEQMKNK